MGFKPLKRTALRGFYFMASLKTYNVRNCRKFCGSAKKKMQAAS
jgi:hypothetical protein